MGLGASRSLTNPGELLLVSYPIAAVAIQQELEQVCCLRLCLKDKIQYTAALIDAEPLFYPPPTHTHTHTRTHTHTHTHTNT